MLLSGRDSNNLMYQIMTNKSIGDAKTHYQKRLTTSLLSLKSKIRLWVKEIPSLIKFHVVFFFIKERAFCIFAWDAKMYV